MTTEKKTPTPTATQKAKAIRELNDIVALRNHIYTLVNGPRTELITREEERQLRAFANQLDREVIDKSLEMVIMPDKPQPVARNTHKAMAAANAVKAAEKTQASRPVGSFRRADQ